MSKTFYLLKAIGFTSSNVVLIGANGSGKTTFANSIREQLEKQIMALLFQLKNY